MTHKVDPTLSLEFADWLIEKMLDGLPDLALAELYVLGVSTRKVALITEQLRGVAMTSILVSRVSAEMDAVANSGAIIHW